MTIENKTQFNEYGEMINTSRRRPNELWGAYLVRCLQKSGYKIEEHGQKCAPTAKIKAPSHLQRVE